MHACEVQAGSCVLRLWKFVEGSGGTVWEEIRGPPLPLGDPQPGIAVSEPKAKISPGLPSLPVKWPSQPQCGSAPRPGRPPWTWGDDAAGDRRGGDTPFVCSTGSVPEDEPWTSVLGALCRAWGPGGECGRALGNPPGREGAPGRGRLVHGGDPSHHPLRPVRTRETGASRAAEVNVMDRRRPGEPRGRALLGLSLCRRRCPRTAAGGRSRPGWPARRVWRLSRTCRAPPPSPPLPRGLDKDAAGGWLAVGRLLPLTIAASGTGLELRAPSGLL